MTVSQDSNEASPGLRLPIEFLVFLMYPLITLLNPAKQFQDPGVGWHLVTGRLILETGKIPTADVFSFTATGTEWPSFYWLFQLLAAILHSIGGLPLFGAATILVFAVVPVLLYRRMLRMGVGSMLALLVALLAQIVLLSHALTRPHVITYVFFSLLVDRLDRFQNGELTVRQLWWLPFLAGLWCNFHGGFVIGLVLVGLYMFASGSKYLFTKDEDQRRLTMTYAGLLAAMSLATLMNPAGPWLHLSIINYLGMESTSHFLEWGSLKFDTSSSSMVLEALILSFIVLVIAGARLAWVEVVLLVYFLHVSLHAHRHGILFAIITFPILAREFLAAIQRSSPKQGAVLGRRIEPPSAWSRAAFYTVACSFFLWLAASGRLNYPDDLNDINLTSEAVAFIEEQPERFKRPYNTDSLGGPLIYRFWPALHVFMDDRTPVYGDPFILDEVLKIQNAESGWQDILDDWEIESAIVATGTKIAKVLEVSPGWETGHKDEKIAIYFRRMSRSDSNAE